MTTHVTEKVLVQAYRDATTYPSKDTQTTVITIIVAETGGKRSKRTRCYCAVYQNRPNAFLATLHIHVKTRYYDVTRFVVLQDY